MSAAPASRQLIAQAIASHDAGRLADADAIVRHILTSEPDHPGALNILGSILLRSGHVDAAATVLTRAIQVAPRAAEPRINLGHAQKALGRVAEAITSYRAAVRLKPRDGLAHYALGGGLLRDGQHKAAIPALREAVRLLPRFAAAHNNLGHALRETGKPAEAEAAFRRAIRLDPNQAETWLNLALAVGEQKRRDDAIAALKEALRLAPDNIDALHAYGTMMVESRQFDEAIPPLRRLRALRPGAPDPFAGLAQALTAVGRFDEALTVARETVDLEPDNTGARTNYAATLLALGRFDEAEAGFARVLGQRPDSARARVGRAFARMRTGRLEEAWEDYDARLDPEFAASGMERSIAIDPARLDSQPWTGDPRDGRPLLVYPEQGLGDAIQMARYIPLLAGDGPVYWLVPESLRRLAASVPGVTAVLGFGDEVPPHDLHCPIMSLPRLFRTTLATIPAQVPYLHPDPGQTATWRARLAGYPGLKAGLAWKGNPDYIFDRLRSVPADQLAPLTGTEGVVFVSLQIPAEEAPFPMLDWTGELTDFAETAALMGALDVILTVDTSVAHLAGAIGRPVWLLNRFNSDWRWLAGRTDSPWYPTMRIFTQPAPLDWASVLTAARTALRALPVAATGPV